MTRTDMTRKELRGTLRLAVANKAQLVISDEEINCMVRDMSDSGLLIICHRPLEVGQKLRFSCELFPKKVLDCMIEVVHISDIGVGAKYIDLDARRNNMIAVYLQEVFALGGKARS